MNTSLPGTTGVSRRAFLKASLAQGAVALLAGPGLASVAKDADPSAGLCVTICNHWSYIGIGWQLGIESCVLSANDAMAATLGNRSQAEALGEAWKHLLAAQSHDVGLCEYSRWQGDRMAPADRLEDFHNFTWGAIGYNHLDAARQQAQPMLDASLKQIAARINSRAGQRGPQAITVFNPLGCSRTDVVETGRIYPLPPATRDLAVRNRAGQASASQMVKQTRDADGNLVGKEGGLLVLHPGTQFFRRQQGGAVGNLVMREWESHFTREYGWPIYAEYHYRLMPHGSEMTNSERLRAVAGFSRPPLCVVGPPQNGDLPSRKSFLEVGPGGVQLSALRRKADGSVELRVVEVEGWRQEAMLTLGFPGAAAAETNLLGGKVADALLKDGAIRTSLEPWKIRTFALR